MGDCHPGGGCDLHGFRKYLGNQPKVLLHSQRSFVIPGNATPFLPAMLQRVESKVAELGGIYGGFGEDAKQPARFLKSGHQLMPSKRKSTS
ncbi:hypothetical protein SDC9_163349 [bioreactor metagenome]|uniref:Uncharacterized protein n=1 Tax=bioreactor metagenome TaxID=1076179 RepID=A0A645FNL6_9ZZZZ